MEEIRLLVWIAREWTISDDTAAEQWIKILIVSCQCRTFVQSLHKPGQSRTGSLTWMTGQQLKMTMGLTGTGPGTTVEEPKPCAVPVDLHQGTPVLRLKPVDLGCPALGDQQHVPTLHGVLVENQNVMVVNPFNL